MERVRSSCTKHGISSSKGNSETVTAAPKKRDLRGHYCEGFSRFSAKVAIENPSGKLYNMLLNFVKEEVDLSEFENLNPRINGSSSVPELIAFIKHSFLDREYDEVQNILLEREMNMKIEMEKLVKDRDAILDKLGSFEREIGLMHLGKLKLEEKLKRRENECDALKEKINRMSEDPKLLRERAGSAVDHCIKVGPEQPKIMVEKDEMILKLNKEIEELKSKNLEHERIEGMYEVKFKDWDSRATKFVKEMKELKEEKLAADQLVKELKREQLETDRTIEELRKKNLEASQVLEDLRCQKLETDKAARFHRKRFEELQRRIVQLEETLVEILCPKMNGLPDEAKCQIMVQEQKTSFLNSEVEKEVSRNGNMQALKKADGVNISVASPGMPSACYSSGRDHSGSLKEGDPHGSDLDLDNKVRVKEPLMHISGRSKKPMSLCPPPKDIIEICDSDEEMPIGATPLKKRASPDDTERISENLSKRKISSCLNDIDSDIAILRAKEEQTLLSADDASLSSRNRIFRRCERKAGGSFDTQTRRWMVALDMLKDLEKDPEVCLSAVCALYRSFRREKSQDMDAESTFDPVHSNSKFSHFDATSVPGMAEYLIDGDPELRLKKSVSEVERHRPYVISHCKTIASIYYEKLFQIYYRKEDPFFC